MKLKDAEDKRLEKERLRALRLQKKRKEKVRSGDAEREEAAAGVQLEARLGGSESGSDEGGSDSESGGSEKGYNEGDQESDESEGGVAMSEDDEVGLSESDEGDGLPEVEEAVVPREDRKRKGSAAVQRGGLKKKQREKVEGALSLADQEALALKLLHGRG